MKHIRIFVGTLAVLFGFNSLANWAAKSALNQGETAKTESSDSKDTTRKDGEPTCIVDA